MHLLEKKPGGSPVCESLDVCGQIKQLSPVMSSNWGEFQKTGTRWAAGGVCSGPERVLGKRTLQP